MESYRDQLDADVARRALEIVTARAVRGMEYVALQVRTCRKRLRKRKEIQFVNMQQMYNYLQHSN